MHRMTNASFNALPGPFQHYRLSQSRGMSAMIPGPMPAPVIKQIRQYAASSLAIWQTEIFEL